MPYPPTKDLGLNMEVSRVFFFLKNRVLIILMFGFLTLADYKLLRRRRPAVTTSPHARPVVPRGYFTVPHRPLHTEGRKIQPVPDGPLRVPREQGHRQAHRRRTRPARLHAQARRRH